MLRNYVKILEEHFETQKVIFWRCELTVCSSSTSDINGFGYFTRNRLIDDILSVSFHSTVFQSTPSCKRNATHLLARF